jgi:hypothetical protein
VADQKPGAQSDEFEEHEGHEEIIGEDEREHAEAKEAEPGVVPGESSLALVVHVPETEEMHQEGDERDDHEHERRKWIEQQAEVQIEGVRRRDERVDLLVVGRPARDGEGNPQREQQRATRRRDARQRPSFGEVLAREQGDDKRR